MNKQVKEAWLADLRSGRYRQGRESLKQRDGGRIKHCCLGVLCETYTRVVKDPKIATEWTDGERTGWTAWSFGGDESMPPKAVLGWAGLSSEQAHDLAEMNDEGAKFREIAKYIEQKL